MTSRKLLKYSPFLVFTAVGLLALPAYAGGTSGGGGDLCQSRIENIRNDIESWIVASGSSTPKEKRGSAQLDFTNSGTDLDTYNRKMQTLITLTRADGQGSISCTNNQSEVQVEGKDKVCVAYFETERPRILCYRGRTQGDGKYVDGFMGASQDEQYFQVHHEFAVLAQFEDQDGQRTNYTLSKQISAHMEDHVERRLAVAPSVVALPPLGQLPASACAKPIEYVRENYRANRDFNYNIAHKFLSDQVKALEKLRKEVASDASFLGPLLTTGNGASDPSVKATVENYERGKFDKASADFTEEDTYCPSGTHSYNERWCGDDYGNSTWPHSKNWSKSLSFGAQTYPGSYSIEACTETYGGRDSKFGRSIKLCSILDLASGVIWGATNQEALQLGRSYIEESDALYQGLKSGYPMCLQAAGFGPH